MGLSWLLVLRDFLCCEVFNVSIAVLDLAEILAREVFLHFSFMAFAALELLADNGTNWMCLLGLRYGCGACISVVYWCFVGLFGVGTLGIALEGMPSIDWTSMRGCTSAWAEPPCGLQVSSPWRSSFNWSSMVEMVSCGFGTGALI